MEVVVVVVVVAIVVVVNVLVCAWNESEFAMEQRMDNGKSVKYLLNLFFHAWQNICIHLSRRNDIHLIHSSFDYAIDRYIHSLYIYINGIEYAKKSNNG